MKITSYHCDICDIDLITSEDKKEITMQVIWVTEQTEGYPSPRYFGLENLHVCKGCKAKALEGNYIFAKGAQDDNDFYFLNKES